MEKKKKCFLKAEGNIFLNRIGLTNHELLWVNVADSVPPGESIGLGYHEKNVSQDNYNYIMKANNLEF